MPEFFTRPRRQVMLALVALLGWATNASATSPTETRLFAVPAATLWKTVDFYNHGQAQIAHGQLSLQQGYDLTGMTWGGQVLRDRYELELEAMRTAGNDFFCGLTFPIGEAAATLIVGGWGGGVVGLSNVDGFDASENETSTYREFQSQRWYKIRVKVTPTKVAAWIDDEQVVNLKRAGHQFSVRWEVEPCVPLGLATWQTSAQFRNLRMRDLTPRKPAVGRDAWVPARNDRPRWRRKRCVCR